MATVVERLGYTRLWVAEHHGMPAVASSAPAVLIAHLANATSTLRVGSGGVMLPNHSPLVMAEQFGTLEALHPGRIDLGLGRAPGTDQVTARALRRTAGHERRHLPRRRRRADQISPAQRGPPEPPVGRARAVATSPRCGCSAPPSSAPSWPGMLGLPFSFAYHFAPKLLDAALETYRSNFRPSILHSEPRAMVAVTVSVRPPKTKPDGFPGHRL